MLEILFRGKCGNGEWIEGFYKNVNNICYITDSEDNYYIVKPKTVGQSTGLYDKNGVEIFEGDIVKFSDNLDSKESYLISWINCGFYIEDEFSTSPLTRFSKVEVIGNIWDNSGLWKGAIE